MRKNFLLFLSVLLIFAGQHVSFAQERGIVTGWVLNSETGKPFDKDLAICIYAFDTVQEGETAFYSDRKLIQSLENFICPDEYGLYSAAVPTDGAIILQIEGQNLKLEKVEGRKEVNFNVPQRTTFKGSLINALPTVILPVQEVNEQIRDYRKIVSSFVLPEGIVKGDKARMVVWAFVLDPETKDTLARLKPQVYESVGYRSAKEKQRNYNIDNDELAPYVNKDDVLKGLGSVTWSDSLNIKQYDERCIIMGDVQIFNHRDKIIYEQEEICIADSRMRKPIQFLEFTYDRSKYNVDVEKAVVRPLPQIRHKSVEEELVLSFMVNQAKIDNNDEAGLDELTKARKELLDIVNSENSKLVEFSLGMTSSPDGPYMKNLELTKNRFSVVLDSIWGQVPERVRKYVMYTINYKVAPWTDVADSLEAKGLEVKAGEIRAIVENNENRDWQWQHIRKLPYYKSMISPILASMRKITLNYKYDVLEVPSATDDEYRLAQAFAMCYNGYYKGGDNREEVLQRKEWFDIVANSSPQNKVVMMLAMDTAAHNYLAEKALDQMSPNSALTWYFKAIISSRKCEGKNYDFIEPIIFEEVLGKCFDMNPDFIKLARNDKDINNDLLKEFFKHYPEYDK